MIVAVNSSSLQALPLSRVIGLPYPRRSITTILNLKMILPIQNSLHNKLHILQVKCHKRDATKSSNKSDYCHFRGVVDIECAHFIWSFISISYKPSRKSCYSTRQLYVSWRIRSRSCTWSVFGAKVTPYSDSGRKCTSITRGRERPDPMVALLLICDG